MIALVIQAVNGSSTDEWPNGLRISRRERAAYESAKIATISREAVSCNAGLGGKSLVLRLS
jgi:hypothetical protein